MCPNWIPIESEDGRFEAKLEDGSVVVAKRVVMATGFKDFKYIPDNLAAMLPKDRYQHTCDFVDIESLANKRCLIIGGRQSAYEWAALLNEADCAAIHISHRHKSPQFIPSDWSRADRLVNEMVEKPNMYRDYSEEKKNDLNEWFWIEGRLKLEPWLKVRIEGPNVHIYPETNMIDCQEGEDGGLNISLDNGEQFTVDKVIFATGYQVDISLVSFLAKGNILSKMETEEGFPKLNTSFETNIPGFYITSMPATQDFGLFFAFTISACPAAKILGNDLLKR